MVFRPTPRSPDRAWRLSRRSIRVLSGAAQREATHRANRANAHGSRLPGVVPERISGVEGREPRAISRLARGLTPHCAASLIFSMGSLGSRQARSESHVGGRYTTSPLLLPSFIQDRFWVNPQGGEKWRICRPRPPQTELDGSLGPPSMR